MQVLTILLPKLNINADALEITAGVTFYGAIILFFISLRNLNLDEVMSFSTEHWLSFFYLVIFASIVTFSLLAFASKNISSTDVSSYTYLIPVWAALIETFIMMEKIPTYLWLGIIPILVCNILLLQRTGSNQKQYLNSYRYNVQFRTLTKPAMPKLLCCASF